MSIGDAKSGVSLPGSITTGEVLSMGLPFPATPIICSVGIKTEASGKSKEL
jgi:hypothetical protein